MWHRMSDSPRIEVVIQLLAVSSIPFIPVGKLHQMLAVERWQSMFLSHHVVIDKLVHLKQFWCHGDMEIGGVWWSSTTSGSGCNRVHPRMER